MSSVSVGSLHAEPSSVRPEITIGRRKAMRRANRLSSLLYGVLIVTFRSVQKTQRDARLPWSSRRIPVRFSCPTFLRSPCGAKLPVAETFPNPAHDANTQQYSIAHRA